MGNLRKTLTIAVITIVTALITVGCATVRERERLPERPEWEYVVRVSTRDDRVRHGELRFKGEAITPVFSSVVIDDAKFRYTLRTADEPFRGYRREAEFTLPADHADAEFDASDRSRGWYLAEIGERRADTPENWVWVRRENVGAYVDPTRLGDFASHHRLNRIEAPQVETRVQVQLQYTIRL
ncbi:MAG: hypothetical protein EA426_18210 [Spirochaetaceae bacterium]|nr:MAG: hypothetical protein EA426_18210 [Spirochaetaceae bacterium]